MRHALLGLVFVLVACGGSSRSQGGSRGDDSEGGRGGGTASGGTAGTAGTDGTSGTAGTAAGANGGAGARGGTTGDAGEPGEPDAGEVGGVGNGSGRGGAAGTDPTGGNAGAGATPSITSCTEAFRFAGVWEGNVLDFYFEPLEAIRLVVTPDEDLGGYQATLTWGTGDPPPPVSSGDEPYPDLEFWSGVDDLQPAQSIEPWPGFAYTVVRGAGCDDVFRVSVSVAEPWDEWCSLQEPVYTQEYGWGCTYRGGGSSGDGMCQVQDNRGQPLGEYPLWKCMACGAFGIDGGVCGCDEAGCSFNRNPTHTFEFELTDDGLMSGPDPRCGDCTVRLERVE